jgi:hypothetical protein
MQRSFTARFIQDHCLPQHAPRAAKIQAVLEALAEHWYRTPAEAEIKRVRAAKFVFGEVLATLAALSPAKPGTGAAGSMLRGLYCFRRVDEAAFRHLLPVPPESDTTSADEAGREWGELRRELLMAAPGNIDEGAWELVERQYGSRYAAAGL